MLPLPEQSRLPLPWIDDPTPTSKIQPNITVKLKAFDIPTKPHKRIRKNTWALDSDKSLVRYYNTYRPWTANPGKIPFFEFRGQGPPPKDAGYPGDLYINIAPGQMHRLYVCVRFSRISLWFSASFCLNRSGLSVCHPYLHLARLAICPGEGFTWVAFPIPPHDQGWTLGPVNEDDLIRRMLEQETGVAQPKTAKRRLHDKETSQDSSKRQRLYENTASQSLLNESIPHRSERIHEGKPTSEVSVAEPSNLPQGPSSTASGSARKIPKPVNTAASPSNLPNEPRTSANADIAHPVQTVGSQIPPASIVDRAIHDASVNPIVPLDVKSEDAGSQPSWEPHARCIAHLEEKMRDVLDSAATARNERDTAVREREEFARACEKATRERDELARKCAAFERKEVELTRQRDAAEAERTEAEQERDKARQRLVDARDQVVVGRAEILRLSDVLKEREAAYGALERKYAKTMDGLRGLAAAD
ncbi:hypothetical protein PLICRDRAFT_95917 [Plicaturopsis crispa FD-325 SS-3]|uniref:Uncharacterized protein n=1 Tax=Plicaturopsis crispa FD-325 SS-3 TaxID=944288 RepID=A0A0C9SK97_PLICR|nr:hypothetical protein PLICRDRAFT_95917 [Plicaturopsis crispa FD-325 SS-3]